MNAPKQIRAHCPEHGMSPFVWEEVGLAWFCEGHAECLAIVAYSQAVANPDGDWRVWQPLSKRYDLPEVSA